MTLLPATLQSLNWRSRKAKKPVLQLFLWHWLEHLACVFSFLDTFGILRKALPPHRDRTSWTCTVSQGLRLLVGCRWLSYSWQACLPCYGLLLLLSIFYDGDGSEGPPDRLRTCVCAVLPPAGVIWRDFPRVRKLPQMPAKMSSLGCLERSQAERWDIIRYVGPSVASFEGVLGWFGFVARCESTFEWRGVVFFLRVGRFSCFLVFAVIG